METSLPPAIPQTAAAPRSSLSARLFNVFATPGEVFEEVKGSPSSNANWLVPMLLASLVGIIHVMIVFSQETVWHQLREQQEKTLEKSLAHMPKEQREQALAMTEKFFTPTFYKLMGSFGAVAGSFGWLFFLALLIWLLGAKLFKHDFLFIKAVEVCGLSAMIGVLGGIVSTLLVVATGNLHATAGPSLLVREFEAGNKVHMALAAMNVMTLWYVSVLALGLSKLSGASWAKAFLWLFTPWAVLKAAMILLGFAAQGMG